MTENLPDAMFPPLNSLDRRGRQRMFKRESVRTMTSTAYLIVICKLRKPSRQLDFPSSLRSSTDLVLAPG